MEMRLERLRCESVAVMPHSTLTGVPGRGANRLTANTALSSVPSSSLVNASAPPTDTMWPRSRGWSTTNAPEP